MKPKRSETKADRPPFPYLSADDLDGLTRYLRGQNWLEPGERIEQAEKAGEGNMNLVLRVFTGGRTFIVKQARPWVEKYPQVSAPVERARVEALYYQTVSADPEVASFMPVLEGADPEANVLVFEDLGPARDFTFLYTGESLSVEVLHLLLRYLSCLHQRFHAGDLHADLSNRLMRILNHDHIFRIPLEGSGPNLDSLTPGLENAATALREDREYRNRCEALGQIYLDTGPSLLHGDFFPGSWLQAGDRVLVIDPEFCFVGPPEFDLGILLAHLFMTRQEPDLVQEIWTSYESDSPVDTRLAEGFAGVEIMRRLIGVAQLPLRANLEEKCRLLELSHRLVNAWTGIGKPN